MRQLLKFPSDLWEEILGLLDKFTKKFPLAKYFRYKPLWSLPARFWIGQTRLAPILRLIRFAAPGELRGARLSKRNLRGLTFEGFNISQSDFNDSDLRHANFANTRLTDVDFFSANLRHTNFDGATFVKVDHAGTQTPSVQLGGSDIRSSNISAAQIRNANFESLIGIDQVTDLEPEELYPERRVDRLREVFINDSPRFSNAVGEARKHVNEDTASQYVEILLATNSELAQQIDPPEAYQNRAPFIAHITAGKKGRVSANKALAKFDEASGKLSSKARHRRR